MAQQELWKVRALPDGAFLQFELGETDDTLILGKGKNCPFKKASEQLTKLFQQVYVKVDGEFKQIDPQHFMKQYHQILRPAIDPVS